MYIERERETRQRQTDFIENAIFLGNYLFMMSFWVALKRAVWLALKRADWLRRVKLLKVFPMKVFPVVVQFRLGFKLCSTSTTLPAVPHDS